MIIIINLVLLSEEVTMKALVQLAIATTVLASAIAASAQSLTEAQARAIIAPWYSLFNQPVQGDVGGAARAGAHC
jgi:hypothetical protein